MTHDPDSDCEEIWHECEACGGSGAVHYCGEDTCCCHPPELNADCDECRGEGGWHERI